MIDDLFIENFLQTTLGFGPSAQMDLERLIIGGHSFGGMTAIEVAANDERIKAVFSFDPWLWAR